MKEVVRAPKAPAVGGELDSISPKELQMSRSALLPGGVTLQNMISAPLRAVMPCSQM